MGIKMDRPPSEMSLADLTVCCAREMARYRRKEPCNDQYCLEIFHRAVFLRNEDAWAILQKQFTEYVRMWLGRHPYREVALRIEPEEKSYIDDAFTRFWRAVNEQKLQFITLAAALSYLHLCLHSTIMDSLRSYSRPKEEPMPDYGHPDEPLVEDHYYETELWEIIKQLLPGEREKRVAYLHFHCNLKPREIVRFVPQEFSSEDEIYRLKRNIMERLLRHADTIRWKLRGYEA